MLSATISAGDLVQIVSVLFGGGIVGSIVALGRRSADRDSVLVTTASEATKVLESVNTALAAELERVRKELEACETREAGRIYGIPRDEGR